MTHKCNRDFSCLQILRKIEKWRFKCHLQWTLKETGGQQFINVQFINSYKVHLNIKYLSFKDILLLFHLLSYTHTILNTVLKYSCWVTVITIDDISANYKLTISDFSDCASCLTSLIGQYSSWPTVIMKTRGHVISCKIVDAFSQFIN